jgi:hypothetical protein
MLYHETLQRTAEGQEPDRRRLVWKFPAGAWSALRRTQGLERRGMTISVMRQWVKIPVAPLSQPLGRYECPRYADVAEHGEKKKSCTRRCMPSTQREGIPSCMIAMEIFMWSKALRKLEDFKGIVCMMPSWGCHDQKRALRRSYRPEIAQPQRECRCRRIHIQLSTGRPSGRSASTCIFQGSSAASIGNGQQRLGSPPGRSKMLMDAAIGRANSKTGSDGIRASGMAFFRKEGIGIERWTRDRRGQLVGFCFLPTNSARMSSLAGVEDSEGLRREVVS